jgi:glutathione S-transferase
MIILHHLEYSQSFRILWLLEELKVEYGLQKYNRDPITHLAPEAYKAISPMGTAPVITHGDRALAETAAIMDYIIDLYPDEILRPEVGTPHRARYLFWFHAAQGSIMPLMLMESVFHIIQTKVPALLRLIIRPIFAKASKGFIKTRMVKLLAQAEKDLAQCDWFGGEALTCADILLSYPIESAQKRGYLTQDYPNTCAWLERIYARPAFKRAKIEDGRDSMVLPL